MSEDADRAAVLHVVKMCLQHMPNDHGIAGYALLSLVVSWVAAIPKQHRLEVFRRWDDKLVEGLCSEDILCVCALDEGEDPPPRSQRH